jgi:multidrug transporter EmrE-like cation transporter
MATFFLAVLCIAFSVAAQFLLKAGMSSTSVASALTEPFGIKTAWHIFTNGSVLLGFLCYGLSAIAWLGVLANWDVSKAYPLVGLGFAITVTVGWTLGEHVTPARFLGVLLICGGVVLVARS